MYTCINGQFINSGNAHLSPDNRSFRYGDGCFETMRLVDGKLPLASLHFERLFHTLGALQMQYPGFLNAAYLQKQVLELAAKNQLSQSARIRLSFFRGNGGMYDAGDRQAGWIIQCWPIPSIPPDLNSNGLVSGIYDQGFKAADALANLKTNNFLLYSLAAIHAKAQQWNDALILNHKGSIADATIANFFLIAGKKIWTPPLDDGPVNGVMRRYLLEKLPALGFEPQEKSIGWTEIEQAEAAFLTNAVFGIKWIQSIGSKQFEASHSPAIYRQLIVPVFNQSFF